MGKGGGGHFRRTKGSGSISSVMKNGKLSISKLRENPKSFFWKISKRYCKLA